jgi:hypothetical protein
MIELPGESSSSGRYSGDSFMPDKELELVVAEDLTEIGSWEVLVVSSDSRLFL